MGDAWTWCTVAGKGDALKLGQWCTVPMIDDGMFGTVYQVPCLVPCWYRVWYRVGTVFGTVYPCRVPLPCTL